MKLILLLILIIAPLHILCQNFNVLGELVKSDSRYYYPSAHPTNYNAYYIKTSSFPKDDILYFKMTIRYGYFRGSSMYYEGRNSIVNSLYLNSRQDYNSRDYTSIYSGSFYNSYTYYYKVSKPSYDYLYVAPPNYEYHSGISSVEVYSTNSFGISIWVWIGIGIFVLVVIILSIVFYACKRAQRKAQEESLQNPSVDPIPLNTNPVSNEPINVNINHISPPSQVPYNPNPNPNAFAPAQYSPVPSPYGPVPSPYNQPPPGY